MVASSHECVSLSECVGVDAHPTSHPDIQGVGKVSGVFLIVLHYPTLLPSFSFWYC